MNISNSILNRTAIKIKPKQKFIKFCVNTLNSSLSVMKYYFQPSIQFKENHLMIPSIYEYFTVKNKNWFLFYCFFFISHSCYSMSFLSQYLIALLKFSRKNKNNMSKCFDHFHVPLRRLHVTDICTKWNPHQSAHWLMCTTWYHKQLKI